MNATRQLLFGALVFLAAGVVAAAEPQSPGGAHPGGSASGDRGRSHGGEAIEAEPGTQREGAVGSNRSLRSPGATGATGTPQQGRTGARGGPAGGVSDPYGAQRNTGPGDEVGHPQQPPVHDPRTGTRR